MASSHGDSTTHTGARKRLIQPVLPILPLSSKINRRTQKVQDEEKHTVQDTNGVNHEGQPNAVADKLPLAEPVGVISPSSDEKQVRVELERVEDGDQAPVMHTVHSKQEDGSTNTFPPDSAYAISGTESYADREEAAPSVELSSVLDSGFSVGATSTTTQFTIPEHGNEEEPPKRIQSVQNHNMNHSDSAPEVITALGEVSPMSYRSRNPSLSFTGLPYAPAHTGTVSVPTRAANSAEIVGPNINGSRISARLAADINTTPSTKVFMPSGEALSPPRPNAFPTVLSHISALERSHDWADCEIQVLLPGGTGPALLRPGHSIMLLRSPRLRNMLYAQRAQQYLFYLVVLFPSRVIDPNAFDAALKFLYTDTILSAERLLPLNSLMERHSKIRALDYILSYMAAGLELGIEPVVARAFELLDRLIDWDVAEMIVKEVAALRTAAVIVPTSPPELRTAAASLLQLCFNLFIFQFDIQQFQLDHEATPSYMTSRLAPFDSSRGAVNPALAAMVFGSMPASATDSPTSPSEASTEPSLSYTSTASTILLNLGFDDLCVLAHGLQKVHGTNGVRVIRGAVAERERRRLNVFENRSISNKQRTSNENIWDVIGWREHVTDDHLQRDRVGFTLSNHSKRSTFT